MPIEFDCNECGQRLRVPDGSGGKKVRCPECETVCVIPDLSAPDSPISPEPDYTRHPQPADASENPFAAPNVSYERKPVAFGTLNHEIVDFGDVLSQTWARCKEQFGMCLLFTLIFFGISIAAGIVGQVFQVLGMLANNEFVLVFAMIIGFVVQQCVSAYQQTVGKRFGLNVVRGIEPLQDIFGFDGVLPVIGLILLLSLIGGLVFGLVALVLVGIGSLGDVAVIIAIGLGIVAVFGFIWFFLRFFLCIYFIVDGNMGVFASLEQSAYYMRGNKGQVFLAMFIGGFAMMLLTLVTCGIGMLFAVPFMEVLQAMIYSKATGQYQNQVSL